MGPGGTHGYLPYSALSDEPARRTRHSAPPVIRLRRRNTSWLKTSFRYGRSPCVRRDSVSTCTHRQHRSVSRLVDARRARFRDVSTYVYSVDTAGFRPYLLAVGRNQYSE